MIDPADVAEVAAVTLTSQGHSGQTYVVTGDEAISYAEVAAQLSAATGDPVGYADIPPEALSSALTAAGLPPFAVEAFVAVFGELRQGVQETTTDIVQTLTGRAPRSFAEFARTHASVFGRSGVPVGV